MTNKFKILVCINQCFPPDHALESRNPDKNKTASARSFNVADRCALEEALKIKKELTDVEITSALVGAPDMVWILQASLGLGVDDVVHFITDPEKYYDSSAIALKLCEYILQEKFNLILCSYEDNSGNFQAGPAGSIVAELLQYPFISEAASLKLDLQNNALTVRRKLAKGNRLEIETTLPAVISVSTVLNEPRYISMRKKKNPLRVETKREPVIEETDSTQTTQLTKLLKITPMKPRPRQTEIAGGNLPVQKRLDFIISGGSTVKEKTKVIEGHVDELSDQLLKFMMKEKML